ncbi:MAG TPA: YceI family protein [Bacteroidales bacterium]
MKKIILSLALISVIGLTANAQKYITKNGHIYFHSEAPLETIEAHNKQVNAAIDASTGDFVFKVLMNAFVFEKALMQEHFNENYVESEKYPNGTFKGKIVNLSEIDFSKPGKYPATVSGEMTIHGITQKVEEKGTLEISKESVHATSSFMLKIADYNINIPGAVAGKIADEVEINVDLKLSPVSK